MTQKWNTPTRYVFIGLSLIFLVFVGWQVRELFKPLITAALIAYIFYPFVELLHRRFNLSHAAASRIVYFISLALMIAVPLSLAPTLVRQIQSVATDLLNTLDGVETFLSTPIKLANLELHLETLVPNMKNSLTNLLAPLPEDALTLLETTSRGTLWFLVIVISVYYFMTDWDKMRDWFFGLAPQDYQHDIWRIYAEIKKIWISYLRGQLNLMIIVALTFSIVWSIIGLPGALLLGLLAGLFSLIPDVGPFVATVLAVLVAILEGSTAAWMPDNRFAFAAVVGGLYVILINIKNIWLRPRIYGRSVHMHEGIVFVAIIAAVIFTGIIGAFIVVPVLASFGVIGRYLYARIYSLPAFEDEIPASPPAPLPGSPKRTRSTPRPARPRKTNRN